LAGAFCNPIAALIVDEGVGFVFGIVVNWNQVISLSSFNLELGVGAKSPELS